LPYFEFHSSVLCVDRFIRFVSAGPQAIRVPIFGTRQPNLMNDDDIGRLTAARQQSDVAGAVAGRPPFAGRRSGSAAGVATPPPSAGGRSQAATASGLAAATAGRSGSVGVSEAMGAVEAAQLRRQAASTSGALDRERVKVRELQLSLAAAQTENSNLKRELALLHRAPPPAAAARGAAPCKAQAPAAHVPIAVADELRQQIAALEEQLERAVQGDARLAESAALHAEVKRLEGQRGELLNVVKKQNRLIEVLRRQKLHLEAAKLLQITEDEFRKAVDGPL
jgi:hypothetical protein